MYSGMSKGKTGHGGHMTETEAKLLAARAAAKEAEKALDEVDEMPESSMMWIHLMEGSAHLHDAAGCIYLALKCVRKETQEDA
jgi:hypothetical protein